MTLRKTTFDPLVQQTFSVRLGEGRTQELRLATISCRQGSPLFESFTLNFDPADGAPPLAGGSYLVTAPGFGPEWIYLSATHAATLDPNDYYYESVFNVPV